MSNLTDLLSNLTSSTLATTTDGIVENPNTDRDENLARVEVATLAIIFLVTILGNGTVLLALWTRKRYAGRKKLSRMYFFILHLSIADLITAFLSVLPQLVWEVTYRFNGGIILCKVVKYGQTLGPYLSSYVLMATAIDRHQAICYPLTYCSWTSRRSKVMVWLAWASSLAFCIPQLTIFAYQEVAPGVEDCWATFTQPWGERAYVTWYSISVFIVPLIVLIVTYSCICHEIWHSAVGELGMRPRGYNTNALYHKSYGGGGGNTAGSMMPNSGAGAGNNTYSYHSTANGGSTATSGGRATNTAAGGARGKRTPLISRAKINTVKQTIAVIVMYVVCSTPFISAQLWATWDPEAYKSPFLDGPVFTILTLLYSLNSCVNPWIYLAFNRELPRLLLRHYTTTSKSYRSAAGNSTSNSSGGAGGGGGGLNGNTAADSTSLRFTRWSFCNNNHQQHHRINKYSAPSVIRAAGATNNPSTINGTATNGQPATPANNQTQQYHRHRGYNARRWIVTTTT